MVVCPLKINVVKNIFLPLKKSERISEKSKAQNKYILLYDSDIWTHSFFCLLSPHSDAVFRVSRGLDTLRTQTATATTRNKKAGAFLDASARTLYNACVSWLTASSKEGARMSKYEKYSLILQALGTAALVFEVFFK